MIPTDIQHLLIRHRYSFIFGYFLTLYQAIMGAIVMKIEYLRLINDCKNWDMLLFSIVIFALICTAFYKSSQFIYQYKQVQKRIKKRALVENVYNITDAYVYQIMRLQKVFWKIYVPYVFLGLIFTIIKLCEYK